MDRMNQVLNNHKEWVNVVQSFGGGSISEDIVQETYIKIINRNYIDKIFKDDKMNKPYIWLTLRSVFYDHCRKKKQEPFIDLDIGEIQIEVQEQQQTNLACLADLEAEKEKLYWYDKQILEINISGKSIRKMSKEIGIDQTSIFHTLKKAKTQIRNNYGKG